MLLVFNRPELTRRLIQNLQRVKPQKIFVVADGPRIGNKHDIEDCRATRAAIEDIDWPCDLVMKYSDMNLGCYRNVADGLTWVFTQVDEAIILEDDCLPHPTFFPYCEELLSRYRDDLRVGVISGNNFQHGVKRGEASYYFSIFNHLWGWATWKRSWSFFDHEMLSWQRGEDAGWLMNLWKEYPQAAAYWVANFDRVSQKKIDSWGYRWTYACWKNQLLTAIPEVNLVSNIGFGPKSTHTKNKNDVAANIAAEAMIFPLRHPSLVTPNRDADIYTQKTIFTPSLLRRIQRKLTDFFR